MYLVYLILIFLNTLLPLPFFFNVIKLKNSAKETQRNNCKHRIWVRLCIGKKGDEAEQDDSDSEGYQTNLSTFHQSSYRIFYALGPYDDPH